MLNHDNESKATKSNKQYTNFTSKKCNIETLRNELTTMNNN